MRQLRHVFDAFVSLNIGKNQVTTGALDVLRADAAADGVPL